MKKKHKKQFLSSFERSTYKLLITVIVLLLLGIVFGKTKLAQVNIEVQNLTNKVDNQKNKNSSLEMKIDEMTSLDRIKQVSEANGLKYNSENIKTIK
jgi:cell division protein FtsL